MTRLFLTFFFLSILCSSSNAGITITSPSGGETWVAGARVTVTWTYDNILDNAVVSVLIRRGPEGGGAMISFADQTTPPLFLITDGSATFNVPLWLGDADHYYIEIRAIDGQFTTASDRTSNPITIVGSETTKSLELDLNLPQQWQAGSTQRITWETENLGSWLIFFLQQNGVDTSFLGNSMLATDGVADITIPEDIGDSVDYRIMVIGDLIAGFNGINQLVFDESAPIEITDSLPRPTLTLISPNGGETITAGSTTSICWESSVTDGFVVMTFKKDDTYLSFNPLISSVSNGCRSTFPCSVFDGDDYRVNIRITSESGVTIDDYSDETFTMVPNSSQSSIKLTSHNNGADIPAGSLQTVTWAKRTNDNISVRLVASNSHGLKIRFLGNPKPFVDSYDWTACPMDVEDAEYRIDLCLTGGSCETICESSALPFDIVLPPNAPSLELLSPKGDELLIVGTTSTITWDAQNAAGREVEVFLTFSGNESTLTAIGTVPAEAGQIEWTVTETPFDFRNLSIVARITEGECTIAIDRADFLTVRTVDCTCGDIDDNFAMDLFDHALIAHCVGFPSSITPECTCSDLDGDGRVNMRDYAMFQNLFDIGSDTLPPDCP